MKQIIYRHSPPILQDLWASLYGYSLRRQRFGSVYWSERRYLSSRRVTDPEWISREKKDCLAALLVHCHSRSPYYKELLPHPSEITAENALSVLFSLPLLDKETLRERISDVRAIHIRDAVAVNTGGTSGKSLQVYYRPEDVQKRFAILHDFQARFTPDPISSRKATFSGREIVHSGQRGRPWRNNVAFNQRLYSTFHLHGSDLTNIVNDLLKYRPHTINGFVSAIHLVAKYILDRGIQVNEPPSAIFTTSEMLMDYARADIERAFRCKVYNQYGSAEGAPIVTECAYGALHLNTYSGLIEIVERDGRHEACVTSFTNYGTPLLRYLIGDVMSYGLEQCECGSAEPVISSIEGRNLDFLYDANGGEVSASHLSDVIKGIPNSVKRVQFVQDRIGEVHVNIEIDSVRFSDNDLRKIENAAAYRFGDTEIKIHMHDRIPVTSGGKFKMVVNRVGAT